MSGKGRTRKQTGCQKLLTTTDDKRAVHVWETCASERLGLALTRSALPAQCPPAPRAARGVMLGASGRGNGTLARRGSDRASFKLRRATPSKRDAKFATASPRSAAAPCATRRRLEPRDRAHGDGCALCAGRSRGGERGRAQLRPRDGVGVRRSTWYGRRSSLLM